MYGEHVSVDGMKQHNKAELQGLKQFAYDLSEISTLNEKKKEMLILLTRVNFLFLLGIYTAFVSLFVLQSAKRHCAWRRFDLV